MIKTKLDDLEYWDLRNIKICYISPQNGNYDFYAKSEDILEEAIIEYKMGNLMSLDMIFLNVN
jgi:hypothetical protein